MKNFFFFFSFFIIFSFCFQALNSQQKGSFNINVTIKTGNRPVCFYVPTDYDSTKKYKVMICLHGAGQPASSYRDNLAVPLAAFIFNTIFACPEGGGPSGDFYYQQGDETIIDSTISYLKSNYSIDEKEIILEGFSLGGRSALKYGLEHPELFKGLFLNTPAVQSNLDANNSPIYGLNYKYENSTKVPVAITHGANDAGYYNIIDTVFKRLTDVNGMVYFVRIIGLGHRIPNQTIIQKCLDFLNQPLKNVLDADITNVMPPERVYENKVKPLLRIRNFGQTTITSASIRYSFDNTGFTATTQWNGSLKSFEHADVELPEMPCQENYNTLKVKIVGINGQNADPALSIKEDSAQFQCLTQSLKLPDMLGFEQTEPNINIWGTHTAGGMWSWGVYTDAKTQGSNGICMYNMPIVNINKGTSEDLLSPLYDLTSVKNPCIKFDLSFNYFYFSPPILGYNTFTDTLHILISTDSGKTFTDIYTKSGNDLATTTPPMTPPLTNINLNDWIYIPGNLSQWRTDIVKLDAYKDMTKAVFIFKYMSGSGGTIWLDNINFMSYDNIGDVTDNSNNTGFLISPNPAVNLLNIVLPENTKEIYFRDLAGSILLSKKIEQNLKEIQLNIENLANGSYFIEISTGNKKYRQKLVILK